MASDDFRAAYLRDIVRTYQLYKTLGDRAIAQVSDEALHALVDPEANSIAIIVKHLAGNLRSRFTDFLTTDGEKPFRNRDAEFEMPDRVAREEMLKGWDASWRIALGAIEGLAPADLDRTVYIRGEAFQVVEALNRLAAHAAYHVGQIVFLAKHLAGAKWTSLTIPKNRSAEAKGEYKKAVG